MKRRPIWITCLAIAVLVLPLLGLVAVRPAQAVRLGPQDARPRIDGVHQGNTPVSACGVLITSTLTPDSLKLCESAEVSVTMAVTCPLQLPIRLVIAVDRSGSIADVSGNNFLADIKSSARAVIDALDLSANPQNKVAVLSHGFRVIRETDLTNDPSRAIGAINGIRYIASDIGENPPDAIREATRMLVNERLNGVAGVEIILLYGDGCDPSEASCPSQIRGASGAANGADITVMTMCYANSPRASCQNYRVAASSASDYFENTSSQVDDRVKTLKQQGTNVKLKTLQLVDVLGPGIELVTGSAAPAPAIAGQSLTFKWSDLVNGQIVGASYKVRGRAVGAAPLRAAGSSATLTDSLDRAGVPRMPQSHTLTVTGPCLAPTPTPIPATSEPPTAAPTDAPTSTPTSTSTPLPPTLTPTPTATFTPSATPTPWIRYAYLPMAMRNVCKRADVHTDVALVIDSSNSMLEPSGNTSKLAAAKAAASRFVELLTNGDQAALIAFNHLAELRVPLTADRAQLTGSINAIATDAGTRIDLALDVALAEMTSSRLRSGNNRVVVLITDGRPDGGTADTVRQSAKAVKAQGIVIYTVGLGADVDAALLTEIASGPGFYFAAPAAADLQRIYESVAYALPCPGGVLWGEP